MEVDPSKDSGSKVSAEEFGSHFGKLERGKNQKIRGRGGGIKLNVKIDRKKSGKEVLSGRRREKKEARRNTRP